MAKNLTVNRQKSDNYTVNRHSGQTSKPISAVKCLTFSLNQELRIDLSRVKLCCLQMIVLIYHKMHLCASPLTPSLGSLG